MTGAILLRRFQKMSWPYGGRRKALDVSIFILRDRRSISGASCCVFFPNRIVRAASSGDNVQIARQSWHFVLRDESGSLARNIDFEVADFGVH